jgi:ribosome-associated protein
MEKTCVVSGDYIRLSDALKLSGLAGTGGLAKILVQEGEVCVDGKIVTQRGRKLRPGMLVECRGQRLRILAHGEDA